LINGVRYSTVTKERKGVSRAFLAFGPDFEEQRNRPAHAGRLAIAKSLRRGNVRRITLHIRITNMRPLPFALALSLVAAVSFAADAADPVNEVMKITEDNWTSNDSDWKYIFDAEPLGRLFSKRFQTAYAEASKHPAYETENNQPGDPFGYDVVTASQDGCPLEDVKIVAAPPADGKTNIAVTFKQWTCVDDADLKNSVSEVHFDVIEEGGRPVIDDIHRVADGESDSLIEEMQSIATGE
jgi:hypothetical protein